ncbi:hypothetical protein C0J52_22981 [Blattella germanica]|nr:hypothetical protein C0J52_22981 [Blattella germanica]
MAKTNTVHVMKKEIEILQQQMKILTRDVVDLKLKVSPDSAVASEVHVGAETDSSESAETLLKSEQEFFEKRLKTLEERLEALQNSQAEQNQRLQSDKSQVNEKGAKGWTQLILAARNNDIVRTGVLLKIGADVNISDDRGWFPLHHAASRGFAEVCALLLLVGNADLNANTKGNCTPLHIAAANGHKKVVELLIKFGADLNLKCLDGKTAYEYAVEMMK